MLTNLLRPLLITITLGLSIPAYSQSLQLDKTQMDNLGVSYQTAVSVSETKSHHYPAKVSVPNANRHIVHTSQEGVVTQMLVAEGDIVKAGQVLATVNSPALLSLQTQYLQAEGLLNQLLTEMQRDKQLFNEGIIAERRYLDAKTRYQQQKTLVDSQIKTLQLAGMPLDAIKTLKQQQTMDSHLHVRAVSEGVVMAQNAVIGQRVMASDVLYEVADLSTLWLEIHVPLLVASNINIGSKVMVCDRDVSASVMTVGRQVHNIDQGVLVRAETSENTGLLTPGEFVQVCFVQNTQSMLYEIPYKAILRVEGITHIFYFDGQSISLRPVHIVSQSENSVTVSDAFLSNGYVIDEGVSSLKSAWQAEGK
ncbi:efflux RND transporter periplasmic adaptor subunit [Methylophaga thalassica]|uniref:efflux RND transporter periplasmic adaptor subunit n=1 Tax=Methylophaga aminisulfidivorans TaxID=230105 RepID=UPI0024E2116C|nr:efflux RND transporter periplasmic adaptor subunit [Methylophaga aminisulfidivorans]